jgi:hypothetical protein
MPDNANQILNERDAAYWSRHSEDREPARFTRAFKRNHGSPHCGRCNDNPVSYFTSCYNCWQPEDDGTAPYRAPVEYIPSARYLLATSNKPRVESAQRPPRIFRAGAWVDIDTAFPVTLHIKELKHDHIVARMASAMVAAMGEHGCVMRGHLADAGFLPREIDTHWFAARALAQQFQPHLFRNAPDWGC